MITIRAGEENLHSSPTNIVFAADRLADRNPVAVARQPAEPVAAAATVRKEFLPRRSGEPRFAPPQYVYSASRSGAVPSETPVRTTTQAA